VGATFGALYASSAALFLGAVLLDVVYSSLLGEADESSIRTVYAEVSDFLLLLGAATFLAGVAANAACWNHARARTLFLISLIVLSVEFVVPVVLFPVLKTSADPSGSGITPFIRLIPLALATLLALVGVLSLLSNAESRGE